MTVRLAVYLPLLAPVLAALVARYLAARVPPRPATWLLTTMAVVLAGVSCAALAALAATALGQIPWLADTGHWSASVLHRHDPTALALAVAAGVLLAGAGTAAVLMVCRRIAALRDAARMVREFRTDEPTAVLTDPFPAAYTLPGWRGRVVVSTGLLTALDAHERRIVLAHEFAHLTGRHYVFLTLADLAAAANPVLRPVAAAVHFSTERWADEHAAEVAGDRGLVARTVGKAALLTWQQHHPRTPPAGALAIGGVLRRARSVGPVPRRVLALLAPPLRGRPALIAVTVAAVLITGVAGVEAFRDLDALFELAQAV